MLKPLCDLRVICTYVMIQPLSCMAMQQHSLVKKLLFSAIKSLNLSWSLSQIVLLMINQIWSALSFFKLMTINYFVVLICDRKHFLYHLEWRNYSLQVSLNDARERRYRFDRIFSGQTTNREVCWEYWIVILYHELYNLHSNAFVKHLRWGSMLPPDYPVIRHPLVGLGRDWCKSKVAGGERGDWQEWKQLIIPAFLLTPFSLSLFFSPLSSRPHHQLECLLAHNK